jgi:hypothetical protein
MNTETHRIVGKYVRETDGDMFQQIASYIGSRSLTKVGAHVLTCDAEMYDRILEYHAEEATA